MSRNCVNKVILVGNLGADPEVRFTPNGTQVATSSLATTDYWIDKKGQRQERTEWHRLVLWRKLAGIAAQYLKKGSKLYVEGRLQTRSWDDQKSQRRYLTEVIVRDMQMLDSSGGPGELDLSYADERENRAAPVPAGVEEGEDGLPF